MLELESTAAPSQQQLVVRVTVIEISWHLYVLNCVGLYLAVCTFTTEGDVQKSTEGSEGAGNARTLVVYAVVGFVIGVFIMAVLGAVILVVFVRLMR